MTAQLFLDVVQSLSIILLAIGMIVTNKAIRDYIRRR